MKITEEYKILNSKLHEQFDSYGTSGKKWAAAVEYLYNTFNLSDVLDYGCGKQTLGRALPHLKVKGYDPAIPEVSHPPGPADLVVCGDVLEHIEPQLLDGVIEDLSKLSKKIVFVVLSTREANKYLADGRNAHLIVEPPVWWIKKFERKFDILTVHAKDDVSELILLMVPRRSRLLRLHMRYQWFFASRNTAAQFFRVCYAK